MVDDSSRHAEGLLRMLAPGSRVAGYLLESQIGAGGMAVVFRARDERLSRMVALKVLAPGLAADDAFRQRFIRESRAAAAVDDPHIIPVYEAGESGGVLFIAMRLVVGGDLRSVMLREGPLARERAAALLSPVASALDAAHAADLVHRDVKPANVLVDARPGRPEHVYLSDFGLSKRAAAAVGLTGSGQFMGTAEYAAPEQINGRPVSGQADQYALACVAFETLTGTAPFARPEPMAVLWAHLSEPPPSLVMLRPDLPSGVDRILARALAKEPHHRYGSCREFIDELRVAFGLAPYEAAASSGPRAQMEGAVQNAGARKAPAGPAATPATPAGAAVPAGPTDPRRGRHSSGEAAQPHRSRRRRMGLAALAVVLLAAVGAIAAATHGGFGGQPSPGGLPGTGGQADGLTVSVSRIATLPDPDSAGVDAAAFSPGGSVLVTADRNGGVYLWSMDGDRRTGVIRDPGSNGVAAAAFSSSGRALATGDQNGSAYMWTVATGHLSATLTGPGFSGVEAAQYIPHGKMLATGNEDGSTYLWDPQGNVTATLSDPSSDGVQALAFSPNGQSIATADLDGTTYLWSLATDSRVAALTVPGTSSQAVDGVAFSPNGKLLATADEDGSAYLWNVAGRRRIATLTPPGPGSSSVYGVAFSHNGKILAIADGDGSAYLWDVATGRRIATLNNPGSNSSVSSVAFSPNDKILATADQDGDTILWRITSLASHP